MSEHIVALSDSTFDETISGSEKPVLVDFWAEWCGPCKMIAPVLEEIASENGDKLQIAKLNVDDNPNTAFKFQIRGIPAMLVFKGGQVVEQIVGLTPKEELKRVLDKHI